MKRHRLKNFGPRLAPISTQRLRTPPKTTESFYGSAAWKALMREIIQERGRRCEDPNCETPRGPWGKIYGDHIIEIRDGGAPLDKANILLRCSPCHGRKTAAERVARGARDCSGLA